MSVDLTCLHYFSWIFIDHSLSNIVRISQYIYRNKSAENFFTFFLQVKEVGQGIFFKKSYSTKSCWKVKFAVSAPLHSTFANGPILQGSSASNIKKGLVVQRTQCSTCNSVRCHLMDWFNQRSKSREGSKTDSREIYDISSRYLKCWCHITRGQARVWEVYFRKQIDLDFSNIILSVLEITCSRKFPSVQVYPPISNIGTFFMDWFMDQSQFSGLLFF